MPQDPAPMDQLRDEPLRFLETEQFQEMLSVYRKLKPLEQENPRKFRNQLNTYDFSDIYPIMDTYLQTRALSDPEAVSAVIAEAAPESVAFASTLLDIFETTVAERVQEYDVLGNSPATYFICGVWANMKRGREFHPASNGITVTYDQPDAYGNQNIRYRNKDYEMTLIFEAVEAYTKNLSWTAHRLLIYTLMRGNADNWRNNTATFSIESWCWQGNVTVCRKTPPNVMLPPQLTANIPQNRHSHYGFVTEPQNLFTIEKSRAKVYPARKVRARSPDSDIG